MASHESYRPNQPFAVQSPVEPSGSLESPHNPPSPIVRHDHSLVDSGFAGDVREPLSHSSDPAGVPVTNAPVRSSENGRRAPTRNPVRHDCPYASIDENGDWQGLDYCNNNHGEGFSGRGRLIGHIKRRHPQYYLKFWRH